MKMFKVVAVLLATCALAGCPSTPEEVKAAKESIADFNKKSLKDPEVIGTLSDGREVSMVLARTYKDSYTHFIYFVGDSVSINHRVPYGKGTRNDVQTFIAPNASADEIIAKAKELEAAQILQDENEYQRLKSKLGK